MNVSYSNKKNILILLAAGLVILFMFLLPRPAQATLPNGLTVETLVNASLQDAIRAKFKSGDDGFSDGTDVKNIVMVKFTLAPGGTFGWHQHSGPVWAAVKSGTFTIYEADGSTCIKEDFPAGTVFLDPGDRTHAGVNETNEPVVVYATYMLPDGGAPRVDADKPAVCNQ